MCEIGVMEEDNHEDTDEDHRHSGVVRRINEPPLHHSIDPGALVYSINCI